MEETDLILIRDDTWRFIGGRVIQSRFLCLLYRR